MLRHQPIHLFSSEKLIKLFPSLTAARPGKLRSSFVRFKASAHALPLIPASSVVFSRYSVGRAPITSFKTSNKFSKFLTSPFKTELSPFKDQT